MSRQLAEDFEVVRHARVLFHHHSVGVNVLEGIQRLDAEVGGGRVRMAGLDEVVEGPALVHGGGGHNGFPKNKVDFFARSIREQGGPRPDVAFMKLCYVDFNPATDVDDLFRHYQRTMESLQREYPGIRFGHVTVPLMARPTDLKSSLRRFLGLEVWEDAANAKRAEYNRKLVETFAAPLVYDLALVEATDPDGRPVTFVRDGKRYPALYPGYTDDGGHLNAAGGRVAGGAAIRFLAGALRTRPAR